MTARLRGSAKNAYTCAAITGPTSRTAWISSSPAVHQRFERAEVLRQRLRGRLADVGNAEREQEPVERGPLAALERSDQVARPSARPCGRARPAPRRSACRGRRACATRPQSTSCSISRSPSPSMSIARRDAKCRSDSRRCAAQTSPPVQRATASPSARTTGDPHTGQRRRQLDDPCVGADASRAARAPPPESRHPRAARPRCHRSARPCARARPCCAGSRCSR